MEMGRRGVWRESGVPLSWWRGWEAGSGRKEMFVKQKNIRKLCRDFMCPPVWPGWNWREGIV